MKDFKFLRGHNGRLDMINDNAGVTALFNSDTPEGHYARRHLYHTDINYYNRLRNPQNNNEMERCFYDRAMRQLTEERRSDITRRINGGQSFLTGEETVTTVNPKWWMKVKMFFQNISSYWDQMYGVIAFSTMVTISVILLISKILNIW